MNHTRFKYKMHSLAIVAFSTILVAQQNGPPSSNSPSPSPSGSASPGVAAASAPIAGTYSIEAEIFAYKSLQMNGQTIGADVAGLFTARPAATSLAESTSTSIPQPSTTTSTSGSEATTASSSSSRQPKPGIVIVPSVSVILPAFQLWRANMLVVQNFLNQATKILPSTSSAGCPAQSVTGTGAPSFAAYATGVTQAVGAIQSILSLFASNQSITEFPGTIQDQALMSAVARALRVNKIQVLAPDIFAPWTIDGTTRPDSPFISKLTELITTHSRLQDVYQCSQLTLGAASQLQQAEITRGADFTKLLDTSLTGANRNAVINEIMSLTSQIRYLRLKLGLAGDNQSVINSESAIATAEQTLNDANASTAQKTTAINTIRTNDAAIISSLENPLVGVATLTAAKAQSLVTGIEGYLAGLTGGAVSFTPPTSNTSPSPTGPSTPSPAPAAPAAAAPAAPAPAAQAPGAPTPGTQTPGPPSTANSSPTVSSAASSTPPIVTILQADGLARKMGVQPNDQKTWNFDSWRILWLKSMESGGAIVTQSNILGSHPHFGGGAVSGYALFHLDGTLVCSGNAAAYGGYVKPNNFVKKNASVGAVAMLNLGNNCDPD